MKKSCMFALMVAAAHAATIATYPAGTILENIAVAPGGDLYVTDLGSGTIFRVSPEGSSYEFGHVPGPVAGIAMDTDGTVVAAAGTSFYRFAPDGSPTLVTDIAGAGFLNGVTRLAPGVFLAADDTANLIWRIDLSTDSATPWLTGPLLVPPAGALPIGPNGIKLFRGAAYISDTGAATILRVPILPDGSAGTPGIYASSLMVDDFAFGSDGSIFAATQRGDLIRLRPDGTRSSIPTGTLGDAAVAFGRTSADLHDLYVVNNGGAFLGLPGGPLEASIVRLTTDTTGAVPEASTVWLSAAGLAILVWHRRTFSGGGARL